MSGYVRIHRPLFEEHPAFRNDAEAMAFAWLIVKAQWRPKKVRYKEHVITLQRGQVAVSVRDFAKAMDRDKGWIERLLKRLQNEAMIETLSKTGVTVITICNYNEYQADAVSEKTADETQDKTEARQAQDTEQVKEEREEDNSGSNEPSARELWSLPPVPVEKQTWIDFKANRRRKKLPFTVSTYRSLEAKLDSVSLQTGIPPPALLKHAADEGWGGIYDPNERKRSNERPDNPTAIAVQRITGAFGAHH